MQENFSINQKIEILKSYIRKKINWSEKTLSEYKDIFMRAIEKLGSNDGKYSIIFPLEVNYNFNFSSAC